jgi:hypothetical protein
VAIVLSVPVEEQGRTLVCEECGATADERAAGWRIYLTAEDPPEPLVYCPQCAEREFGS